MSTAAVATQSTGGGEVVDRLSRWNQRWEEKQIGWHEEDVHDALMSHGDMIIPNFQKEGVTRDTSEGDASDEKKESSCSGGGADGPVRVFVPLCGKTVDMAFLAGQDSVSEVVGVDGVRKALEEFGQENPVLNLRPAATADEDAGTDAVAQRFEGDKITLLQADFFRLDDVATGGRFDVVLDRGSLIAIQPDHREEYVDTMGRIIAPGGKILLIVIERKFGTDEDKAGPPFSVPESEVRRLYEPRDWVESITLINDEGEKHRWTGKPINSLYFLIQAK